MTLSVQFLTMLSMVGMGSYLGAAIDTYNRFLQRSKKQIWFVFLNDIFFWFLQGLIFFYVLFEVNQGELRVYIFLAILCGFAAYQSLLKGLYVKGLEVMIELIISIYRFLVKVFMMLVYRPIIALLVGCISLVNILLKGVLALLKWTIQVLWILIKITTTPIKWLLQLFWYFLPKRIKKTVEKLYNKFAGYTRKLKNTLISFISKWKKGKK